jgi:SRSO17 transposase
MASLAVAHRLYLPQDCANDADRRNKSNVPSPSGSDRRPHWTRFARRKPPVFRTARCWAPKLRWRIECDYQELKQELGLAITKGVAGPFCIIT